VRVLKLRSLRIYSLVGPGSLVLVTLISRLRAVPPPCRYPPCEPPRRAPTEPPRFEGAPAPLAPRQWGQIGIGVTRALCAARPPNSYGLGTSFA